MSLAKKYYPSKISDLIFHVKEIKMIENWLCDVNSMKNKNLLVIGSHSIGKSTIVKILLDNLNFDVRKITFNEKTYEKDSLLNYILNNQNIINFRNDGVPVEKIILIDDLDGIILKKDKNLVTQILRQVNGKIPIILISNNKHNKFISDIKKKVTIIKIRDPVASEFNLLISKIIKNEGIKISEQIIYEIITNCQKDIRRLFLQLEIYIQKEKEYFCIYQKDKEFDLFQETKSILTNFENIPKTLDIYNMEKVILPLMIYQNYPLILGKINEKNKSDINLDILENISYGDIIENNIYNNQNWNLQDIHGFYTCVIPCYLLSEESANTHKHSFQNLEFAIDLNKTSIKKINKKNISFISNILTRYNICDYLYMSNLFQEMIAKEYIKKLIKILKYHCIDYNTLEILLKINKLTNKKQNLHIKYKKFFPKN